MEHITMPIFQIKEFKWNAPDESFGISISLAAAV